MVTKARIVVLVSDELVTDVDVELKAAPSFILGWHFGVSDASIYMEGELIDTAALARRFSPADPTAPQSATPAEAPAAAPASMALQLGDFKTFTELMHGSLAALTQLQLQTFESAAANTRRLFDEQMKDLREYAKECSDQRRQHREALKEIDTFDRGLHVAAAAEHAAFRAAQFGRKKPEAEGITTSDLITGFSNIGGQPS